MRGVNCLNNTLSPQMRVMPNKAEVKINAFIENWYKEETNITGNSAIPKVESAIPKVENGDKIMMDGSFYPIEICVGQLNGNAAEAFSFGQCHALAMALHEKTGGQIIAHLGEEKLPDHYAVKIKDKVYDIEGERSWQEYLQQAKEEGETLVKQSLEECLQSSKASKYEIPRIEVARSFVDDLLAGQKPEANVT